MSLNATTLTAAIKAQDTYFAVGSVTGISAPVSTTGAGYTYLLVENEIMFVESVNTSTLVVTVLRGQLGTAAVAHGASAAVLAGLPSDFAGFVPQVLAFTTVRTSETGPAAPVAGGATNVATGSFFHLTGTTAMVNLTAPSGYIVGGAVTIVFDGSGSGLTWTNAGNINVAGTATTAGSSVTFVYDGSISKWVPSRLA